MRVEKAEASLRRLDSFKFFGEKPKSATSMHGLITDPSATEGGCLLSFRSGISVDTFSWVEKVCALFWGNIIYIIFRNDHRN